MIANVVSCVSHINTRPPTFCGSSKEVLKVPIYFFKHFFFLKYVNNIDLRMYNYDLLKNKVIFVNSKIKLHDINGVIKV